LQREFEEKVGTPEEYDLIEAGLGIINAQIYYDLSASDVRYRYLIAYECVLLLVMNI